MSAPRNHREFAWACHDLFFGSLTEDSFAKRVTDLGFTIVDAAEEICRLRYSGENGENPSSEVLDDLVDGYLASVAEQSTLSNAREDRGSE